MYVTKKNDFPWDDDGEGAGCGFAETSYAFLI
jgi:hypothetical protein